jgi:energy-coupling factor transporter ATP-binding protein EcfA2
MDPECKSMVIYGANGSGKSSFVDAVEYALSDERIGHLAHEYSGKNLKNAVPNTHKPEDKKTTLSIKLSDGSAVNTEIKSDGSTKTSGSIGAWDYRRTVLRQGEVVEFIQDTKGGKYSALLPLFGLQPMEIAAENLRQVAKNVEILSQLDARKAVLAQVNLKRTTAFGAATDEQILKKIEVLHGKYCGEKNSTKDVIPRCKESVSAIDAKIAQISADQACHITLRSAGNVDLKSDVDALRAAILKLAGEVDPLISHKLAVLQPTETLLAKLPKEGEVECPACGQLIRADEFRDHVRSEFERLREIRETFNARNAAMGCLCDDVKTLKLYIGKPEAKLWREEAAKGELADCFDYLSTVNADALRTACSESDLQDIEKKLLPLIVAADLATAQAPTSVKELLDDKHTVEAAKAAIEAKEQAADVGRADALTHLVRAVEQTTREQIRLRSNAVIAEISEDIKKMWSILHPGEAIEGIRLYLPKDADKAIDIGLKFHGKQLDSPRLTLSEGYRNSLGLCIFLAMAKREAVHDRPVILDDVVVSLDRKHRGMIVQLLEEEFAGRQVLLLTHDRDWFTELRQQLDEKSWAFKTLLPYESPQIGIRWSHKTTTFDDARAQLKERPDSAGNDARKIMDVELAFIAEHLQTKLPYLRFEKNDRRTAYEILSRILADSKKCFQIRIGADFVAHENAIETLSIADKLLISWANRASHSFDVTFSEASKLIDACEKAIECFKCSSCRKHVWFTEASGAEWVQCQCGGIRWRYGKGG